VILFLSQFFPLFQIQLCPNNRHYMGIDDNFGHFNYWVGKAVLKKFIATIYT
jgi:hypothetical protein